MGLWSKKLWSKVPSGQRDSGQRIHAVGNSPLTQDHHHGLVLGGDPLPCRHLPPQLVVKNIHTVGRVTPVEHELVQLLQHTENLSNSAIGAVDG